MKINKLVFLLALLLFCAALSATIFDNTHPSAKAVGMGGSFVSLNGGAESVFYNPAGILGTEKWGLFLSYKKPFSLDFINESIGAVSYDLGKMGVVAFGYNGMSVGLDGDTLTSEQTLILSYANSFYSDRSATFNAGFSVKYLGLMFKDYGSASNFSIDLGIMAKVGKNTYLGFSLQDFNSPEFGKDITERIPVKMNFGVAYEPYYGTKTLIEIEKNEFEPARIHAGAEFGIMEYLILRAGIGTNPTVMNAGLTVKYSIVGIDYAFEYHNTLGITHHFGFTLNY